MDRIPVPGKDGNKYVPFEQRTGESSVVFFTRDLSEKGLQKIYDRVSEVLTGKVAVKLHTGEPEGPNILPRVWVKDLLKNRLPDATIIETNTYYKGGRYTTEDHLKTLERTAGRSARSTSRTRTALPRCLLRAESGSRRCMSAKAC